MNIREINDGDVEELIVLRTKTDENNYSIRELSESGIIKETVIQKIHEDYNGWLCEIEKTIVGFAMGQKTTGEMWVIAVLPNFINMGIGTKLLNKVETWLFEQGNEKIWLTTDIDEKLRAYSFYKKNGWKDDKIEDGLRFMVKEKGSPIP